MIRNQWYVVFDAEKLPQGKLVGMTRFGEKLVFWRERGGGVACIADVCCHRGASLSKGRLRHVSGDELAVAESGTSLARGSLRHDRLECPFHGFQYDASGRVVEIPANGRHSLVPDNFRVKSYVAREAYGFIWVWYGVAIDPLPEIPFFEELREGFSYGQHSERWNVHYTRSIENQLDVVHLPFVHRTTIGKGNRSLVDGPVVVWEGERMTFYVKNEVDRGQLPLSPEAIADYESLFSLQFQMPNTWQNRISDRLRVMAAFVPIDDENTLIYLRFYQRFVTFPVLRNLVNFVGAKILNRIILQQDRRVVLTQVPKKSELEMDENLIQGDLPIVEYRRKREELKNRQI